MNTLNLTQTFVTENCCSCGITFAMTSGFHKARRDDRKNFYCPNGHAQHYAGQTEAERLRKELKYARSSAQAARDQAAATERSNSALRGVNTRTKNRIANGLCPCCRRTFQDLHRHMQGQHPDYAGENK